MGRQPFLVGVKLEPRTVFRAKSFSEVTMKYVFHASFAEVKQPWLSGSFLWNSRVPKEEVSPRGKFNKCGLSKLRALS